MELITLLFRLPFLPVSGVIKVAQLVADEADRELHDPARVRRDLEDAQRRRDAGEISDYQLARIEDEAMARLGGGAGAWEGRHGE